MARAKSLRQAEASLVSLNRGEEANVAGAEA